MDETGAGTIIVEGVAGNLLRHRRHGRGLGGIRGGARVELRMDAESARRLAEQLHEQVRLLEAYRADTAGAEDNRNVISALSAPSPDVSADR